MEFIIALIYIALGLIGGSAHYLKKRYLDETTKQSFVEYLKGEPKYTKRAIVSIIGTEIGLSLASGGVIGLSQIVSAVTTGYAVDSGVNKASDQATHTIETEE